MTLPAKKVVTFKCSDVLRAAMNRKEDGGIPNFELNQPRDEPAKW
jgi:hypothetical protein